MTDMDHATKQAVSHLAAQLGEELKIELNFSFAELSRHIGVFRDVMAEISGSVGASKDDLKLAANELLPKIEAARGELETAARNFSESAKELRGGFFEKLDVRIEKLIKENEKIVKSLSGDLSALSGDLRGVKNALSESSVHLTETGQKLDDTVSGLRKEIDNWGGLLRAGNHAHSKELDALSSELSELIKSVKTRLLEEVDEQINLRDNRVRQDIADAEAKISKRVARFEKIIWAWIIGGVFLPAIIVLYFLL